MKNFIMCFLVIFIAGALDCYNYDSNAADASLPSPDGNIQDFLPFSLPPLEQLRASPKKVFAHYFPPFPISSDNLDPSHDQWVKHIMNPEGFNGKYKEFGGKCRQRPLPRPVRETENWALEDMKLEVRRATALGIDGFVCDVVSEKGINWERVNNLMQAADIIDPTFKIMIMAGMPALFQESKRNKKIQTPQRMADIIINLAKYKSAYRMEDGRLVISAFRGNDKPVEWWKEVFSIVKSAGIETAFVPLIQPWWDGDDKWRFEAEKFKAISVGLGTWGTRWASSATKWKGFTQSVHEFTPICFFPVGSQDFRAKSGIYWEASNTLSYRALWQAAIASNTEWVQLITWNDYSEGTEICPSSATQYSLYDLTAYYSTWFKTGKQPEITHDVIYYSHRLHSIKAKPEHTKQPKLFTEVSGEPLRDDIEIVCFLTKPGLLTVTVADVIYTVEVISGLSEVRFPIQDGRPEFKLSRSGKTVIDFKSDFIIDSQSITYQDLLYRGGSSSRYQKINTGK